MNQNGVDVKPPAAERRRRSGVSHRLLLCVAVLAVVTTACGSSASYGEAARALANPVEPDQPHLADADHSDAVTDDSAASAAAAVPDAGARAPLEPTFTPLQMANTTLPPARIGFEGLIAATPAGPQPVSMAIENIDVRDAEIIPVGVNQEDLSFEVPPAEQVGWYEFGPLPGQAGSAVLAAHIAYNGVDGVFRYLEDVEIGSVVVIEFDDGSTLRYQIEDVTEYDKDALPDSLWALDGREQLALITCGGAFNEQLDSYESNIVAIAVPI